MMVIELDQIMRGGEPLLRTSGMVASRSVKKVRHRRDSYLVIPIAVSGVATPENKVYRNSLALSSISKKVGTRCPSPSYERFLGRMQFTLHATRRTPHGTSRLVQAFSAWLVKTRLAPSRHSGDARVYGHTTTAMHKLSTPPPHLATFAH